MIWLHWTISSPMSFVVSFSTLHGCIIFYTAWWLWKWMHWDKDCVDPKKKTKGQLTLLIFDAGKCDTIVNWSLIVSKNICMPVWNVWTCHEHWQSKTHANCSSKSRRHAWNECFLRANMKDIMLWVGGMLIAKSICPFGKRQRTKLKITQFPFQISSNFQTSCNSKAGFVIDTKCSMADSKCFHLYATLSVAIIGENIWKAVCVPSATPN